MLNVAGLPMVREWHAVRLRDKAVMPAGQALWKFLSTEGQQFLPQPVSGPTKPL
jgi:hypothetical protein